LFKVDTAVLPSPSVTVIIEGAGDTVGIAEALNPVVADALTSIGPYVLLANPELTIPPKLAGTDVLNVYGGVVNVGVGTRKLGRVESIVV